MAKRTVAGRGNFYIGMELRCPGGRGFVARRTLAIAGCRDVIGFRGCPGVARSYGMATGTTGRAAVVHRGRLPGGPDGVTTATCCQGHRRCLVGRCSCRGATGGTLAVVAGGAVG